MPNQDIYKGISLIDKGAVLKVSKDNLTVYVQGLVKEFYNEICEKIPKILKNCGIVYGIKDIPEIRDNILIVAEGKAPINGEDGKIEIVANSWQKQEKTPDSDSADVIDYKNLNIIKNVSKGETIAKRIPPTKGEPGIDVFGREIPAKPGEWKLFKPGERVEIVDENTLVATDYGALLIEDDGTISVKNEWTINGDVDWSTGHVEFYGEKLFIKGSVLGGFTVECTGDVEIEKNVEDEAIILTGGDLIVKGIIRSKDTIIKTGKNLVCDMIEYSKVFVGKDLRVREYLLNVDCRVHGSVEVFGGKGLIAGGKVLMGGSLKVNTLGTPANVPTVIGAGLDPLLMLHYKSYIEEQESLANKLEKVRQGLLKIKALEKKRGQLDNKLLVLKENLQDAAFVITNELNKNKEKIKALEEELGLMERATVTVIGTAYANTILNVFQASLTIKRPIERMLFFYKAGEVLAKHLN